MILSDFAKILTVATQHHVLPPLKFSWKSDFIRVSNLDFKIKEWHFEFMKIWFLWGDNDKLCKGRINHVLKIVVWVVVDLQKKFQPLFNIFCLPKINDKNCYHYSINCLFITFVQTDRKHCALILVFYYGCLILVFYYGYLWRL